MRGFVLVVLLFVGVESYSQTARDMVRSGNVNFAKDSLNDAIEDYVKALDIDPNLEAAKFNMGDAYYRLGKYEDAAKTFNELAQGTADKDLKSKAFYNLGNSMMESKKYQEAMNAYKSAMRANPNNSNARKNYEYARKMLAEQQKQEQENKDQNKDQDKKNQDKKDQNKDNKGDNKGDNKDDQKKDQNKDQDNKDKKDKEGNNQKDQDKKDNDQKNQDQKDPNDQQQSKNQKPQPGQMTKADAERLLQAMEDKEKKTREKVAKQKSRVRSKKKSDKDW